uniref:Uncharacterized protein n=1 Tax=Mustela putorius furo TaxID=9669 RepID=M3Y4R9_MUSPF
MATCGPRHSRGRREDQQKTHLSLPRLQSPRPNSCRPGERAHGESQEVENTHAKPPRLLSSRNTKATSHFRDSREIQLRRRNLALKAQSRHLQDRMRPGAPGRHAHSPPVPGTPSLAPGRAREKARRSKASGKSSSIASSPFLIT